MNQEYALVPRAVVESERFYTMPVSAQALYFLVLTKYGDEAEAFGNVYNLIRRIGCSKEDLEILLQEGYVNNE